MVLPSKPTPNRIHLLRLLSFGLFVVAVRFLYIVSINGGSCYSSTLCLFSDDSADNFAVIDSARISQIVPGDPSLSLQSKDHPKGVQFYSSLFHDLLIEGFLNTSLQSLCLQTEMGHEALALKAIGVKKSISVLTNLPKLNFNNNTFDFVFVGKSLDLSKSPFELAEEIVRVLKPHGFFVILTESGGDSYSEFSINDLFTSSRKVRSREIQSPDSMRKTLKEIVFQKEEGQVSNRYNDLESDINGDSINKCSVPEHKLQLVQSAEQLIHEEPLKPWLTLKRNVKNIKYLPAVADISFKRRYIYIDVGARSYGSSIGSWFKKQYPKQNHTFEIYAIEADKAFHKEYSTKKGIILLPFAAWVRNETLSFEVNHEKDMKSDEKGGKGMGRIRPTGLPLDRESVGDMHLIQGFDLAEWLKSTVSEKDFVVMKMDIEGTEFNIIPRLFESGAICLIDELFLECHYNRWQRCCPGERSPKYEYTYGQCLELFSSLRDNGVLVHQWW